jgi:hypothetical protein
MTSNDEVDVWPIAERVDAGPLEMAPHCLWIKITQLLGEVSCYLLPIHDGNHCSVELMEWA